MTLHVVYACAGIAPYVMGGMQTVARTHVEGLAALGVELDIVHTFIREPVTETDLPGREHVVPWPDGMVKGRLPGHFARGMSTLSESVARVVGDVEPDVVYADGPLLDALLARDARPPLVFHPHGLEPFQDLGRLRDNSRARSLRPIHRRHAACDIVISQGGRLNEILTDRMGVAPERIRVLPNSVPDDLVMDTDRTRGRPLRLLFVGRDEPRKGLRVLLDAIRAIDGVTLEIVGPATRRGTDNVTWRGPIRDREQMIAAYDNADVLVLPSFAEGFPTVLLEAMARGLPVIGSDVGAVAEAVVSGETGWLVPSGSTDALRDAIGQASTLDDDTFRTLSTAARGRVASRFTRTRVSAQLADLLSAVRRDPQVP